MGNRLKWWIGCDLQFINDLAQSTVITCTETRTFEFTPESLLTDCFHFPLQYTYPYFKLNCNSFKDIKLGMSKIDSTEQLSFRALACLNGSSIIWLKAFYLWCFKFYWTSTLQANYVEYYQKRKWTLSNMQMYVKDRVERFD